MAISVGTIVSNSIGNNATLDLTVTCDTGTTVLVAIFVNGNNGFTQTSVTYNGVALTKQVQVGAGPIASIWTLLAPPTGSALTLEFKISGTNAAEYISGAGVPVLGGDTTTPVDTTASYDQSGLNNNITTGVANALIMNACSMALSGVPSSPTVANSETTIFNTDIVLSRYHMSAYKIVGAAGVYTTGWNHAADNANNEEEAIISLKPAAVATSTFLPRRMKMGVGL